MIFARKRNPNSYFGRISLLKKLFWLYFLLLIFEGALRKWLAPAFDIPWLSPALLIVRDPVGVLIIWEAFRTKRWPHRWSVALAFITLLMVGIFAIQLDAGVNRLIIGLYGLRSYLLPFPVLFIMGENLDEEDLRNIAKFVLWLLLPMALLEIAQYLSPSDSILNSGSYEGAGQIRYASGHVRASGTFSFVVGASDYAVMAAAFLFYGLVKQGRFAVWLLWAAALALIVSVPMTGERAGVFELAGVLGCVALGAMMGIAQFGRTLKVIVPILLIAALASFLPVFSNAMGSFTDRFQEGAQAEGGGSERGVLDYRLITPLVNTWQGLDFVNDPLGKGLGRGAIAMQALLHGSLSLVLGEDVFHREFSEMGPYVGLGYELFKLWLVLILLGRALVAAREDEPLALLMVPLAAASLLFATPEQACQGGFTVVAISFCIAASKLRRPAAVSVTHSLSNFRDQVLAARRMRGAALANPAIARRQLRGPETSPPTEEI